MALEAHVTEATYETIKSATETLITAEGITSTNFQGVSIARHSRDVEKVIIVIIADTGA